MGMPMADMIRRAIADPHGLRAEMMRRGAETQQQTFDALRATSPPPSGPIDRLERLAALKDRGLLTDEEFEQQKHRILGS
jgi:hypothetical protein